jgi:hypothetical protein
MALLFQGYGWPLKQLARPEQVQTTPSAGVVVQWNSTLHEQTVPFIGISFVPGQV